MIEINCPYCGVSQKITLPKDKGLEACVKCHKPIDTYPDGDIMKSNLRLSTNAKHDIPGNVCTGFGGGKTSFNLDIK